MINKDQIIVALDVQTKEQFNQLASKLEGHASFVKVGMELFYSFGPSIIKSLKDMGYKVFLDLKIHDIPNTAMSATKTITKLGADIINVHAAGGITMMEAARKGMEEALIEDTSLSRPLIIGVTQLTSTDQDTLEKDLMIPKKLEDVVIHYAKNAKAAGLDGVVCSPLEVTIIKENLGADFKCITPGIRAKSSAAGDQKRIATPEEAIQLGSDYLVIGRAITNHENPASAFDQIIQG